MNLVSVFYFQNILFYTSLIPLIGIFLLIFINPEKKNLLKVIALHFSSLPFLIFLGIWSGFKK